MNPSSLILELIDLVESLHIIKKQQPNDKEEEEEEKGGEFEEKKESSSSSSSMEEELVSLRVENKNMFALMEENRLLKDRILQLESSSSSSIHVPSLPLPPSTPSFPNHHNNEEDMVMTDEEIMSLISTNSSNLRSISSQMNHLEKEVSSPRNKQHVK